MTAPSRRWSFSLRTLFVVVTVVALPMAWLAWNAHQVYERQRTLLLIESRGTVFASFDNEGELPLLWEFLGARRLAFVIIPEGACTAAELEQIKYLCPDATIRVYPQTDSAFTEYR